MVNCNAERPLAEGIFQTIDIILTFALSFPQFEETLIVCADVVVTVTVTAAEEDIALVLPSYGNCDARAIVRTNCMLATFHNVAAFVAAWTVLRDALLIVIANHVLRGAILVCHAVIATHFIDLYAGIIPAD